MLTEEEKLRYLQESEPLIRYEAWRFWSKFRGLFDLEDVRQECRIFLWLTLGGYDPSKSKLSTYFSRFIQYKLQNRFFPPAREYPVCRAGGPGMAAGNVFR